MGFKYDAYLAGPWEKFAPEPYKTMIKEAFPALAFFDPENQPYQSNLPRDYVFGDLQAIADSRFLVALAPGNFPMPALGAEIGVHFQRNAGKRDLARDLRDNTLILIWNDQAIPPAVAWGKPFYSEMGLVVPDTMGAIEALARGIEKYGQVSP